MESNQKLSQNIKLLRKERGKNLEEFASDSGVGRSTVQDIESGKANVTLDTVDTISSHLGISTLELLSMPQDTPWLLLRTLDKFSSLDAKRRGEAIHYFKRLLDVFEGGAP